MQLYIGSRAGAASCCSRRLDGVDTRDFAVVQKQSQRRCDTWRRTHWLHCLGRVNVVTRSKVLFSDVAVSTADSTYAAAAAYLRSIGFLNAADLARVLDIATNPDSMFVDYNDPKRSRNNSARQLDVLKDIKPVVNFLSEKNLKPEQILKVISGHPPILSYDVNDRLARFWSYLESFNIDVAQTISNRPSLVGLDADKNLRKIVEYLQYIETPPEKIAEYLRTSI